MSDHRKDFTTFYLKMDDGHVHTVHLKNKSDIINNKSLPMNVENKPLKTKEELDNLDTMLSIVAEASLLISKIHTLPKAREKAVVATKLEEAIMWAELDIKRNHKL